MSKDNVYDLLRTIGAVILGCATIAGVLYSLIFMPLSNRIDLNCNALAAECIKRGDGDSVINQKVDNMNLDIKCRLVKICTKMGIEDK